MGNRRVEVGIGTNFEGKVHLAIELISTVRSLKDQKQISCVEWENPRLMVRQSSECGLLSDRQSQTLFQRPRSPSPESRRGVPQFQTRVGRQRGRTFVPWRRRSNCLKTFLYTVLPVELWHLLTIVSFSEQPDIPSGGESLLRKTFSERSLRRPCKVAKRVK